MKLKRKDKVFVLLGKDKGKEGEVVRTYPLSGRVMVKEINMYKKHVKKSEAYPQGGTVALERSMDVSKVALICPHCKARVRVGYSIDKKGKKVRICRACKKDLN